MTVEYIISKLHEEAPLWDESRERRVFNRIQNEINRPRWWQMDRSQMLLVAFIALSAIVLIFLLNT